MFALTSALGSALQGLWQQEAPPQTCSVDAIRQAMLKALDLEAVVPGGGTLLSGAY